MTFTEFMAQKTVSDAALAKKLGVTRGYITQLRLGIRKKPSLNIALKIERISGGRVPVREWAA